MEATDQITINMPNIDIDDEKRSRRAEPNGSRTRKETMAVQAMQVVVSLLARICRWLLTPLLIFLQLATTNDVIIIISEPEVTFDGERGLHSSMMLCSKNSGHKSFKPVKDFTMEDLPIGYRDRYHLNLAKAQADLTCRVKVPIVSNNESEVYPHNKETSLMHREMKNQERFVVGSGFIHSVGKFGDKDEEEEDYKDVKTSSSQLQQPSKKHWMKIMTDAGIVRPSDVHHTECQFFNESPDKKNLTLTALELVKQEFHEGVCILKFETDELHLVQLVSKRLDRYKGIYDKLYGSKRYTRLPLSSLIRFAIDTFREASLVIVTSYPHGCGKHISVGEVKTRYHFCEGTTYSYTAATCPGSRGGPVNIVGSKTSTDQWCEHPHHGRDEKSGVNRSATSPQKRPNGKHACINTLLGLLIIVSCYWKGMSQEQDVNSDKLVLWFKDVYESRLYSVYESLLKGLCEPWLTYLYKPWLKSSNGSLEENSKKSSLTEILKLAWILLVPFLLFTPASQLTCFRKVIFTLTCMEATTLFLGTTEGLRVLFLLMQACYLQQITSYISHTKCRLWVFWISLILTGGLFLNPMIEKFLITFAVTATLLFFLKFTFYVRTSDSNGWMFWNLLITEVSLLLSPWSWFTVLLLGVVILTTFILLKLTQMRRSRCQALMTRLFVIPYAILSLAIALLVVVSTLQFRWTSVLQTLFYVNVWWPLQSSTYDVQGDNISIGVSTVFRSTYTLLLCYFLS